MLTILNFFGQAAVFMINKGTETSTNGNDYSQIFGYVVCALMIMVIVPIIGLGIFHIILKFKGKTTREFLKKDSVVSGDKKEKNDWLSMTPSWLKFRDLVEQSKVEKLNNWKWLMDSEKEDNYQSTQKAMEKEGRKISDKNLLEYEVEMA